MLEIRNLDKNFGGLAAISEFNLHVKEGEIRGVIGPNGAGKTTLFNVISGVYKPSKGSIRYRGEEISGLPASRIAEKGLVRTFQRTAYFGKFTVLGNVSVARHLHARVGPIGTVFGTARTVETKNQRRALEILDFIGLNHLRDEPAINLPHGHQKALGVAIALAAEPRLLMLDEPVAGMNPTEKQQMTELIRRVRDEWGVTVVLVEHDMKTVMGVCGRVTVLDFGTKLAEGSPEEVLTNDDVIEAYLGVEDIAS